MTWLGCENSIDELQLCVYDGYIYTITIHFKIDYLVSKMEGACELKQLLIFCNYLSLIPFYDWKFFSVDDLFQW